MYEYVSQDRQLRIERGDFAVFRPEGSAESAEGGRRVELGDLPVYLLRDELSFQIYKSRPKVSYATQGPNCAMPEQQGLQCSCFPVRVWPGGGMDSVLLDRTGLPGAETSCILFACGGALLSGVAMFVGFTAMGATALLPRGARVESKREQEAQKKKRPRWVTSSKPAAVLLLLEVVSDPDGGVQCARSGTW